MKYVRISVDICENDSVDVNSGGPDFLGFDFFVKPEESESLVKFVKAKLNQLEIEYFNVSAIPGESETVKFWDKEKINEYLDKEGKKYANFAQNY